MNHFIPKKARIALILAVLLTASLAVAGNVTGLGVPELLVQTVLTPIRAGINSLTVQAEQFYNYMFRYEALAAENKALREQIAKLEDDARTVDAVSRENDRLKALLELKSDHEDFRLLDCYVITWSSNDWTNTITIDRGSDAGIAEGMCAITASGEVVGLVDQVGANYAVIKSVLDSSLEVSATIASSGYSGMVKGGYAAGEEGLLRMEYLSTNAVIRNNDQVVTSGSTVYPRDLILGYVVDAGFDNTGVAKYAVLKPAADFNAMEQVFVLTEYTGG